MEGKLSVGSSLKNEDILWATKFFAESLVFLETDSEKIMVVNELEYGRALKEAKVDTILLSADLCKKSRKRSFSNKECILFLLRKYNVSSVAVDESGFPASLCQYLSQNGISFKFTDFLFPERAIKSADEINDIIYAQRSMEDVFPMCLKILANSTIRKGKLWNGQKYITSKTLRRFFDTELMRRDCVCRVTIIASGDQASDPHCLGSGPIIANTPIVFDMFPRSRKKWYWSDMTRMVVKGKLTPDAKKMFTAVFDAQRKGLDMVKAGINYFDIHKTAAEFLHKQGYRTGKDKMGYRGFFHGIGHGVGLEIHEPPFPKKDTVLGSGNVITIEPGLYYKGIGGVRIEDTVVVTEDGHKNLANLPKELIEIP